MSFKQYLPAHVAAGLDETYKAETTSGSGPEYYAQHIGIIEEHEMMAPVLKECLGAGGMRILESGCGTGRWMAYFDKLGNWTAGIDDSAGPLRVARHHDPGLPLVRGNAVVTPFKSASFDVVFSSYVAEHFEEGPEILFREIHRLLKPNGLFLVVVPFNNAFRRVLVNPALRVFGAYWRLRGWPLAFTEFRYSQREMQGFLQQTQFTIERVLPDDFILPWSKGLFVDFCDLSIFFNHMPKPYEFGPRGQRIARFIHRFGIWTCCAGVFFIARARK